MILHLRWECPLNLRRVRDDAGVEYWLIPGDIPITDIQRMQARLNRPERKPRKFWNSDPERLKAVTADLKDGLSIRAICKRHNISAKTICKIRNGIPNSQNSQQ